MKMYNYFLLRDESDIPMGISISPQLNEHPLSRKDLFDAFFRSSLPLIENLFSSTSCVISASIDRSFFSPFNFDFHFFKYASRLYYVRKVYSFLSDLDKIPFARVSVKVDGFEITYVFFAKEVNNE